MTRSGSLPDALAEAPPAVLVEPVALTLLPELLIAPLLLPWAALALLASLFIAFTCARLANCREPNGTATFFSPMPRKPPTPTTAATAWPLRSTITSLMSPTDSLLALMTFVPIRSEAIIWSGCIWVMNWPLFAPVCAMVEDGCWAFDDAAFIEDEGAAVEFRAGPEAFVSEPAGVLAIPG